MDENPKSPKAITFLTYQIDKNGKSSRSTTKAALGELFLKPQSPIYLLKQRFQLSTLLLCLMGTNYASVRCHSGKLLCMGQHVKFAETTRIYNKTIQEDLSSIPNKGHVIQLINLSDQLDQGCWIYGESIGRQPTMPEQDLALTDYNSGTDG